MRDICKKLGVLRKIKLRRPSGKIYSEYRLNYWNPITYIALVPIGISLFVFGSSSVVQNKDQFY